MRARRQSCLTLTGLVPMIAMYPIGYIADATLQKFYEYPALAGCCSRTGVPRACLGSPRCRRDGTHRRNPGQDRAGDAGRPACRCPLLHARAGENDRLAACAQSSGQKPPRAELCRFAATCAARSRRQSSNGADPGRQAGRHPRLWLDIASLRRARHDGPGGDRDPRSPAGRKARAHAGDLSAAGRDARG